MQTVLDLLFRPLARLAIARGVRFADLAEHLRRAYVDVARDVAGPDATVSRLSVMTGLQRRDVARLLDSPEPPPAPRPDPQSRLVAGWLAEHAGRPLPRHGPDGSFDALARSIRRDIHPKSTLDALVAAGTARVDGETVHLLKTAHVPLEGSDAQIQYLGQNVGDHLAVAVGNVLGDPEAFDLAVHYDGLSVEAAQSLHDLWRARMGPVLQEVSAQARRDQARSDPSTPTARIRGGGYFRVEVSR